MHCYVWLTTSWFKIYTLSDWTRYKVWLNTLSSKWRHSWLDALLCVTEYIIKQDLDTRWLDSLKRVIERHQKRSRHFLIWRIIMCDLYPRVRKHVIMSDLGSGLLEKLWCVILTWAGMSTHQVRLRRVRLWTHYVLWYLHLIPADLYRSKSGIRTFMNSDTAYKAMSGHPRTCNAGVK